MRPVCYLLTVAEGGGPHAVAARPLLADGAVTVEVGSRCMGNATSRPSVSLLYPPTTVDGYSLIVDGTARVDEGRLRITPTRAVLHRPGPRPASAATGGTCGSDCVELTGAPPEP